MCCPFLRDATVNYCREAPAAKALPLEAIHAADSRCNGPEHVSCPYAGGGERGAVAGRCPSLAERQVQYCLAVSAPKFIPALALLPSRCGTEAYRHCALFLERTGAQIAAAGCDPRAAAPPCAFVEGLAVPLELGYTANHLWVDRGADGSCTVGVDALLVRVIGGADRVTFVSSWPGAQPFAVLSVAGLELPLAFPYPLEHSVINYTLRVEPERLADDPFGSGWLFEGYWDGDAGRSSAPPLVSGSRAVAWMRREVERLSNLVHEQIGTRVVDGLRAAADGGVFVAGVARALRREDALHLFSGFFPVPPASWSE
jgi:hypothetical protein